MTIIERALGSLLERNNDLVHRAQRGASNPREMTDDPWNDDLVAAYPTIRAEWDRFEARGGRLPRFEQLLAEHQGNTGSWRAGLLVSNGRPVGPLPDLFPGTMAALGRLTDLRSALFSLMEPGTSLPEHTGPNAGVLRYHLGVKCGNDAGLWVNGVETPYRDGAAILFDDTAPHEAWNHGDHDRITLFCERFAPTGPLVRRLNRGVQWAIGRDHRYRLAPHRAAEWHAALNPTLVPAIES